MLGHIARQHGGVDFMIKGRDAVGVMDPTVASEHESLILPAVQLVELSWLPRPAGHNKKGNLRRGIRPQPVDDGRHVPQGMGHDVMNGNDGVHLESKEVIRVRWFAKRRASWRSFCC